MNLMDRVAFLLGYAKVSRRNSVSGNLSPRDPSQWFGNEGEQTTSGMDINRETAMTTTGTLAATTLLSDCVAMLPLGVYREKRRNGRRELNEVINHPVHELISEQPNKWMTSFTWLEMSMLHLLYESRCYTQIVRNRAGQVVDLLPHMPELVRFDPDKQRYIIEFRSGPRAFKPSQIIHVKVITWDGLEGKSRVALGKEVLGMAKATDKHVAAYYGNSARPSAVIEVDELLDEGAIKRLSEQWYDTYGGSSNAHKTAILEQGAKLKEFGNSMADAQGIESRKYQRNEQATLWRTPPHMVGDLENAAYRNVEHLAIEFGRYTIAPWCRRIEAELKVKLFTRPERKRGFCALFDLGYLLRGDTKTRFEGHSQSIVDGWKSRNEVRAEEGLNPVPGLDNFLVPLNMAVVDPTGKVINVNKEEGGENDSENDQERPVQGEDEDKE